MWFLSDIYWARGLASLLLALAAATAFWMAAHALFPKFSDRSSRRWQRPRQDLGLGLGICLPFSLVALGIGRWMDHSSVVFEVLGVFGVCLASALSLGALAGLAGLALRIGAGMKGAREDRHSWLVSLRGSVVLAAICGFPVLNIFFISVLLAGGLGNFIMTLLRREPPRLGRARSVGSRGLSRSGRGEGEHLDRPVRQPRRARPPRRRDEPDASRTETRRTTAAKGSAPSAGSQ